jgi:hypothetical protein
MSNELRTIFQWGQTPVLQVLSSHRDMLQDWLVRQSYSRFLSPPERWVHLLTTGYYCKVSKRIVCYTWKGLLTEQHHNRLEDHGSMIHGMKQRRESYSRV